MAKKVPAEVLDFFRKQGSKGGKLGGSLGGKRSLETMTPEARIERAKKAVAAREAKRAAAAKAVKKTVVGIAKRRGKPSTP